MRLGERDAMMVDAGGTGRPPGDPPDLGRSWVSKVVGSNVGGRLNPEDLMDDAFVEERVRLEFPGGEDGEPVVTIGSEVLAVMNGLWKQCMIVKVLGRNIGISVFTKRLREMWKPKGAMHVIDLPKQFFMVRFEMEEEYYAALTGGPWRAFGSYLMVKAWVPDFDPLVDEIVTTPVWVRLSNIPVNFYHRAILLSIAKGLGKPIKVDLSTLNFERGRFARICVEVDLKKPLKGSILVNGERYGVSYEGLTNICSVCGMFGHSLYVCPRRSVEKVGEIQPVREMREPSRVSHEEEGFRTVRRSGRRTEQPQKQLVFAAGGSKGNSGRNLKDISSINDGNIMVSNKFGSLDVEENIPIIREEERLKGSDKENLNYGNRVQKGKSGTQDTGLVRNGQISRSGGVGRGGPREKRIGSYKPIERNGVKQNGKAQRPTMGLVFGPVRDEVSVGLSESGKRLRVERDGMGRAGGVFGVDMIGGNGANQAEEPMEEVSISSLSNRKDELPVTELALVVSPSGVEEERRET